MPDLTTSRRQEIAADLMLNRARNIDALDVAERAGAALTDNDIDAITDLIGTANVAITWDATVVADLTAAPYDTDAPTNRSFRTYLDRHEHATLDARAAQAEAERDEALDDLHTARTELARVTDERNAMVNAFARAVSLPPEQVAKAHSVRYTGTPTQPPIASPAAVLGSSSRAQGPDAADLCTRCGTEPRAVGWAVCDRCTWGVLRPVLAPVAAAVERAFGFAAAPTVGGAPAGAQETAQPAAMDGAAHSVWLHGNWRWLTRNMTTKQREAFADAVERYSARLEPEDPAPVDRWWRAAAVDALGEGQP